MVTATSGGGAAATSPLGNTMAALWQNLLAGNPCKVAYVPPESVDRAGDFHVSPHVLDNA